MRLRHEPVLKDLAVELWAPPEARRLVDGTVGRAGHSLTLLAAREDVELLSDIREAITRIRAYIKGMGYGEFLNDTKTQDAVVRNLEIIGEATKNLSDELREDYPEIPWKQQARLRDRLIHHYSGVNYDIVWDIATEELPKVLQQIEAVLEDIGT